MNPLGGQSRIGLKAVRSTALLLVPILVVTLALTAVVSYRLSFARLEEKVSRLGEEHGRSIERMLWEFDMEGVDQRLQSFVDQDDIRLASVSDITGRTVERGRWERDSGGIERVFALTRRDETGDVEALGSLTIQASTEGVWADVLRRGSALIVIVAASATIVVVLILRRLDRDVFVPLSKVAGSLRDAPGELRELHIDLGRGQGRDAGDEIDDLVGSIHRMRDRILATEDEVEARKRRLVQAAQMAGLAYCTLDAEMRRVVECDDNYASLFRRTVSDMLSLDVRDVLGDVSDEQSTVNVETLRTHVLGGDIEVLTHRLDVDDEAVHVRQHFVPVRDENGAVTAVSVIARNVTDELASQEMLLQTQKNDAIGKLTGGVAHDFNNILAVIMGNVEFSVSNSDDPAVKAYGEAALKAVDHGAQLTRQLLSFARKQSLSPVVVDAARIVADSTMLLRTSAGESIDLEIVSDPNTWNTIVDPVQLEAVLLNLVVNARDAMPSGGALTIEIGNARLDQVYATTHAEVDPGDYVRISVTDSGTGMTPHTVKNAVEPFFTTKAVGEGTGLGLSMAYGFAKQSGGHLKIYSEVGHGTTVNLYLPQARTGVAMPSPTSPMTIHGDDVTGLHVLIVEGDDDLRGIIADQIGELGCVVHAAHDGSSARSLIRTVPRLDVLLCDVVLPNGQDGRGVSRSVVDLFPAIKVVFMSGFAESAVMHRRCPGAGAVFLQKPFTSNDLAQVLAGRFPSPSATTGDS